MRCKRGIGVLLCLATMTHAVLAADAKDRRFIREGMGEGEVLMKIGMPDSESISSGRVAKVIVKRWIYLPAEGDSQTLTTITIRDGKVVEVVRKISR